MKQYTFTEENIESLSKTLVAFISLKLIVMSMCKDKEEKQFDEIIQSCSDLIKEWKPKE